MTTVIRPTSFDEAARALARQPGARLLAGGTDLVVHQRDGRKAAPAAWVDLTAVREGRGVRADGARVRVGALTDWETLARDPLVRRTLPALADAAGVFGCLQIRCQGTLGGNVANASPAGDGLPPLVAAGASARLLSPRGAREVAVERLLLGPGRTDLAPDEVITELCWPVLSDAAGGYLRVGEREQHVIAKVSAALHLRLVDGLMVDVRVALGAVAPTPVRAPLAEAALEGLSPREVDRRALALAARAATSPITDLRSTAAYRSEVAGELLGVLIDRLAG